MTVENFIIWMHWDLLEPWNHSVLTGIFVTCFSVSTVCQDWKCGCDEQSHIALHCVSGSPLKVSVQKWNC